MNNANRTKTNKTDPTTRAVPTRGGEVRIRQPDGGTRLAEGRTDWKRVDTLTEAEVESAAREDKDALPLDDDF